MKNIVFAWELGDNLGHLWRMVPIALGLAARGHKLTFILRDMAAAQTALEPRGLRYLPCPSPAKPQRLDRELVSYADILAVNGFGDATLFKGMSAAWQALFELLDADIVVAEHAPSALASARMLGLPTASLGTGFTIPPQASPMPCFRSWAKIAPAQAAHAEAFVLAVINDAFTRHGRPQAPTLAAALTADVQLLLTLPELDHYRGVHRSGHRYLGPVENRDEGEVEAWRQEELPRVFLYLRNNSWLPVVLDAVARHNAEVIAVIPDIPVPLFEQYRHHPRLRIFRRPLKLHPLLPQCTLAVTSAGHGTALDCLLHGVPMLLLPNHIEQFMVTTQIASAGLGLGILPEAVATQFASVLERLLGEPQFGARARAIAQSYASLDTARTLADAVDAIEAVADQDSSGNLEHV